MKIQDIPDRPKHFKSFEAEVDRAMFHLNNGETAEAKKYFNVACAMICYDYNLKRLGTLNVWNEKYRSEI